MTRATEIIPQDVAVYTRDGTVFTNSEILARRFEKRHSDVLRAFKDLTCSDDFRERNFARTLVSREIGSLVRETPIIEMTRDGFVFLAMGFTGPKAATFKESYIAEFNAMEAELKDRRPAPPPAIDLNDPSVLRGMLFDYTGRVIELQATVAVQSEALAIAAPKTQFYDDFAEAEGLVLLTDIGRVLGVQPVKLLRHLVDRGVLFRTSPTAPLRARGEYTSKGWFVTKTTLVDEIARAQTYATPRGLQGVAGMLDRTLDLFGRGSVAYGREGAWA